MEQNNHIIGYSERRDWRGMLLYADDNFGTFSDVNWSTMFSRLGRMTRDAPAIRSDQVFRRLVLAVLGVLARVVLDVRSWLS